eukprot:TRINITY_DN50747_c0_g1_i1.p1 TRINITY_DN50747_c0_g1~~TRINITY_DN50747_c0_g1_i1.p1  ORF type:complete len:378 (+),score=93.08 TRINITY_DN50747_c0_g1_i1:79-1134(+)
MCDEEDQASSRLEQALTALAKGAEAPPQLAPLLDPSHWEGIGSRFGLHCTAEPPQAPAAAQPAPQADGASLLRRGYAATEPIGDPAALEGLRGCMRALRDLGFAPAWIWAYDEAWQLLSAAAGAAAPTLGAPDALVEPTVFAYALAGAEEPDPEAARAEATGSSRQTYPGGNFGIPHRDHLYDECFSADGRPLTLSLWHALCDVSCDSGCMFVVPRPADPLFSNPAHPLHSMPYDHAMESAPTFSLADAVALPCSAGQVLLWCGNTVHWGGRHQSGARAEPRAALTSTLRAAGGKPTKLMELTGLRALRVDELAALPLPRRVRHIAASLLLYKWWYGLDTHHGVWPQRFDS